LLFSSESVEHSDDVDENKKKKMQEMIDKISKKYVNERKILETQWNVRIFVCYYYYEKLLLLYNNCYYIYNFFKYPNIVERKEFVAEDQWLGSEIKVIGEGLRCKDSEYQ
jgi:hypothetical protein